MAKLLINGIVALLFAFFLPNYAMAQDSINYNICKKVINWCGRHHVADNLEAAVTLGSTGIGLEAATPITKWTRLRAGVTWMPGFKVPMYFDVNTYSSEGFATNNFGHVQEMVYELTGLEIDNKVKMIGKPRMVEFKLLVDVFPFQNNRHWHFTAGFFAGGSTLARAYNSSQEKPTLVGLNIYNRAYEYFTNLSGLEIFFVPLGNGNYMDPQLVRRLQDKFSQYGDMGIRIGYFKDGMPYIMKPATDGSVSARAYINRFRPYLGLGYSGALDPTGKWQIGFEAGAMFWGGVPDVIDQNGVNLTKDLVNIRGKVGNYVDVFKHLPVFPVIELKISYTFF